MSREELIAQMALNRMATVDAAILLYGGILTSAMGKDPLASRHIAQMMNVLGNDNTVENNIRIAKGVLEAAGG